MKFSIVSIAIIIMFAGITACSVNSPPSGEHKLVELAPLTSLDILILESLPVQIHARIRGILRDSCTTLRDITRTRKGPTFMLRITTERPADAVCADMITEFEQIIPLDVHNLPAGTYLVDANGLRKTFTLK